MKITTYKMLKEALNRILALGHNDDCMFCGFKDKYINETIAAIKNGDLEVVSKREELAAYAHEAWSRWMQHMFSKANKAKPTALDGCIVIPADLVLRWKRQMTTSYENLPDDEKKSDRKEADRMLSIVHAVE